MVLHPPCTIDTDVLIDRGGASGRITTDAEDYARILAHHDIFFGRVVTEIVVVQAEEDVAVSILDTQVNAGFVGTDGFASECGAAGGRSDAVEAVEDLADGAAYTNAEEYVYPEEFGADSITATVGIGYGIFERGTRSFFQFDSGEVAGDG